MKTSFAVGAFQYNFTGRRDMTDSYLIAQDLSNLDLSKAILDGAQLDCAILNDADLSETSLKNTSFFSTDLEGANLSNAKVDDCDFHHANLERANLEGVDFSNSNVRGALFTDATGLSLKQKLWLKSNGALNISLDNEQLDSLHDNDDSYGLLGKLKSWISFSH